MRPGLSARIRFEVPEDLIGHTLNDRYRILRQLGSGGMGTVYLAEHVLINKQVAVKVLSPSHARKPDEVERFLREARAASRIRHENVVDITDFGYTSGGLAFLVMEFLDGEDLATTSHREGALPWRRALRITRQMCAALEAAHAQGVIHRDMKPENVFRVRRGEDADFVKVLDFGIAKILDETFDPEQPSSTNSGLLGTPEYVAPELIRGLPPDARVDIYAVGVILYRLLTGRVPFAGDSFMATLTQHLMELPTPPRQAAPAADIPEAVEAVCLRSLAKERENRFGTIRELSQALLAAEAAVDGAVLEHSAVLKAPRSRRPLFALLGALAGLALVAVIAVWAYQAGRETQPDTVVTRSDAPAPAPAPVQVSPPPQVEAPPVQVTPPAPAAEPADAAGPDAVDEEPVDDEVEAPGPGPRAGGQKTPLPDRLSLIELRSRMDKLKARVASECSRYAMRKMEVGLQISVAASGKVQSVKPTGSQMGGLASCVVRIAKSAKYRRARHSSDFEYTFRM